MAPSTIDTAAAGVAPRPSDYLDPLARRRRLWQDGVRSGTAGPLNLAELTVAARRALTSPPGA